MAINGQAGGVSGAKKGNEGQINYEFNRSIKNSTKTPSGQ